MDRKKVALFCLCAGVLIILVAGWLIWKNKQEDINVLTKACDGEVACTVEDTEAQNENDFVELSMEEALHRFDAQKDGVYYFGYEDCPWCQDAVPILKEVSEEHQEKVYYVKTRDEDHNLLYDDKQKQRIIDYFGEYMDTDEDGKLTLYVPMVVEMENGQVKHVHIGTLDSYDPNEREMTQEEEQELKKIYEEFFE